MPKKKEDSISIVYDQVEGKPTIAVGGAYGGVAPDGSVVFAHVYTEYGTVPSIEEHEVDEAGKLGEGHRIRRGDVTREVQATLVMAPEVAMRLGNWLVEKARLAIQSRQANPSQ